jgi:regulator of sirC expression with transglutaminase-like and TPR domain
MERSSAVERFRQLAATSPLDIFEGALVIAELVDPSENIAQARASLDQLSARVREGMRSGEPPLDALRRVLFAEEGFSGDTASYDDPTNSSVARVLQTRRGMPITLSIVMVEIGRRAGLDLAGVGLPGHFVVGGRDVPTGLYVDPFESGRLCDTQALTERVSAILGTPVELPDEAFVPDSPRSILTRVLWNLRRSYEKRDRLDEALAALDCAEALDPEETAFRRERGLLLLKAGRTEEALEELRIFAASASGEDAEAVQKLIEIVDEGGAPDAAVVNLSSAHEKRIFTLDEARQLLPQVQEITSRAVGSYVRLGAGDEAEEERQDIVRQWVEQVAALGAEIKGLWLVDFDSGAGYYCWKYPESALEYFHGYEEGFAGRLPLQ